MCAGCFSWCRLRMPWGAKKQSAETNFPGKMRENQTVPKSDEKLSENALAVVPTKTQYFTASGEQALRLLQSAARVIPVPLLQDAIGVALKIIEICREASAVEEKVKELQDRVGHLMIVIVDHVTAKNEEGSKEAIMTAAKGIEKDIKDLLSTLKTIDEELTKVREQGQWLIALYTDLNTNAVESCLNRLSTALEKFKLANDLRDSALLQELQSRLEKVHGLTQQVANKVDVMHEDVKGIKQILAKSRRLATLLPSDSVVRQQMPLKPEVFHGRGDFVEDIARLFLQEDTSRVCILGPGGMGKTSASLAVVESPLLQERFPPRNRVWVPCIEATSATLLLEILYVQLQVPGDKQVTLEKIISELDASKRPCLILLDNFETPWNAPASGTQKQVGDILRSLASLRHVAILVTMRGKYPPCNQAIKWQSKDIQSTDEVACLRIYHDINPDSKNDPDVATLVAALGHMPFAVTLMARLGMEGRSMAKELLDEWHKSGPDIFPNDLEQSMNHSISLSVESDLIKRNPNALLLLSVLSLLPAGTTKENLHWWAPELTTSSAIAILSKTALLVENNRENSSSPILFVVPVVQSFMQQHGRIARDIREQLQLSCCRYVLDHACRFDDPTFPVKSKALAAEDTNIQSILFGSPSQHTVPSDRNMEALIAFSWHRCDTKPSLEIANHAVTAAKASRVERYIASAVWCLGRTYHQLGDYRSSYYHLQEAYRLFNTLPNVEVESQRLGGQCGIDLVDVARLIEDNSNAVSLAQDVERKCATLSDDLVHGRSLVLFGSVLLEAGEHKAALSHLHRARSMLTAVGNSSNLAAVYQIIAHVHYRESRLPQALDAVEEAWRHADSSGSPYIQAVISLEFGITLFSADRDTEAWRYIEIALMKASHVGDRMQVAHALQYMGYGYLRRGDYENSYGAYEAAAEKYLGTLDAWDEKKCKDNMANIKRKRENPDAVVGFYRPGIDVDKSLFYPSVQVSASDVTISDP